MISLAEIRDFCITRNADVLTGAPEEIQLTHVAHYEDACQTSLTWVRYCLTDPCPSPVLLTRGDYTHAPQPNQLIVQCKNPRTLLSSVSRLFFRQLQLHIGETVSLHPTTVVNETGQNYERTKDGWRPLFSAGSVYIDEDVHVGAFTSIMRGVAGNTTIGKGCRIGQHVNIGHDCRIGDHSLIVAHTSLAGWVRIGNWCRIYQGARIRNGVTIGDEAVIGMGAVVTKNVGSREIWAGNPAKQIGYVEDDA